MNEDTSKRDRTLLDGLLNEDPQSFRAFYLEQVQGLYHFVRTLLGNADDSKDVVQSVFASVLRNPTAVVEADSPQGYVYGMARKQALQLQRGKQRADRRAVEYSFRSKSGENDESVDPDELRCLGEALARLPVEQAEVVELHVFQDMTFHHAAAILGVNQKTLMSRYYAALKLLKRTFDESTES